MKVEKNVYSDKLGVDLMVYLSEEDNVIGLNPSATAVRIEVYVVSQEVDISKRRFYKNEYWIQNDKNKFVTAFKRAAREGEDKFSLDEEANKAFESLPSMDESNKKVGDITINIKTQFDADSFIDQFNELLSKTIKKSNLSLK